MSEVEKLKLEVSKCKVSIEIYKSKVNLLPARLNDGACRYDKAMSAMSSHAEDETHWAHMYQKHGKAVFLEVIRIT